MGWLTGWEDDNWDAPTDGGGFFSRLFGMGDDRFASSFARQTEEDLRRWPNWRRGEPLTNDQRQINRTRVRDTQHHMGRGQSGRRDQRSGPGWFHDDDPRY